MPPPATSTSAPTSTPQWTTQNFAKAIQTKYPTGVANDGKSYASMTPEELTGRMIAKYPVYAKQISDYKPTQTEATPSEPGYLSHVRNDISGAVKQGAEAETNASEGKENPLEAGAEIAKDVSGAVISPIAEAVSPVVSPILKAVSDKLGNTPAIKALADVMNKHPELSDTLTSIAQTGLNMVGTVGGGEGAEASIKAAPDVAESAIGAVKNASSKMSEAETASAKTAQEAKQQQFINSTKTDWEKPTTQPGNTFKNAKAVLEQSPETPQFLAEQGIDPHLHVEDGKYVTEGTAQDLRDTAGKMSSDTLRPSLQMADYTTPKTPVDEITNATIKDIKNTKGITPGMAEAQIAQAEKEGTSLEKKYPDGMSLTDMHDEKIGYAGNGKYSPIGDTSVNNTAAMNRAFGRTLASQVETKTPENVPVKAFNQYLAKYYKAADYLESLNGKTAPVSIGHQIARGVAKFGGAAIARHLVPGAGDLVSSFAGYQIGKAVEHAIENIKNPARATFLSNLEKTNPKAFTALQQYMTEKAGGNIGAPKLPAPTRTILPAPSEETQMQGRANTILPK